MRFFTKVNGYSLIVALLLTGCFSQQTIIAPGGKTVVGRDRTVSKTVLANQKSMIDRIFSVNPDCTTRDGAITVRITQPPAHGTVTVSQFSDYPNYPAANPRSACNKQRLPEHLVEYMPQPNFTGADMFSFEVFVDNGQASVNKVMLTVE